jgi:hypothetical protein
MRSMPRGVDVAAELRDSTAFAATWRDPQDAIVGTTFGGTMCEAPHGPNILRLARGDWTIVARCRECRGCIEFDRRRLADRLLGKYGRGAARSADPKTGLPLEPAASAANKSSLLWLIRIYAPLSEHAALSHKLHRRRSLELEPGFFRLGLTSFGVIARSKEGFPRINQGLGLNVRVEPIRLSRGRRAWRAITAGLTVVRAVYGKQVNRWYVRGLPPAEREKWEVVKLVKNSPYGRKTGPRVWAGDRVVLVPPDVWRLPRAARRDIRVLLARAASPEAVAAVMELATSLGSARSLQSSSNRAGGAGSGFEAVKVRNARIAELRAQASSADSDLRSLPPLSEAGGYVSSGHSSGVPPPDPTLTDYDRQLELDGRSRREKVAALKERPWEELTVAERELVHESIRADTAAAPARARAATERAQQAVLDALASLKKKMLGGT